MLTPSFNEPNSQNFFIPDAKSKVNAKTSTQVSSASPLIIADKPAATLIEVMQSYMVSVLGSNAESDSAQALPASTSKIFMDVLVSSILDLLSQDLRNL